MITKIDFVRKKDYLFYTETKTITDVVSGAATYVYGEECGYSVNQAQEFILKSYSKIYSPSKITNEIIEDDGYFVQTAKKFKFKLDSDSWLESNIINVTSDRKMGFLPIVNIPSEWEELIDGIPSECFPENQNAQAWTEQRFRDWFYDKYYKDSHIEVIDIMCIVYEDGVQSYVGFIESTGCEYNPTEKMITVACTSSLRAFSIMNENNVIAIIHPAPTQATVEQLSAKFSFKSLLELFVENANMSIIGKPNKYSGIDSGTRIVNKVLVPRFFEGSDGFEKRTCTRKLVDNEQYQWDAPNYDMMINRAVCFAPCTNDTDGTYQIYDRVVKTQVFLTLGTAGVVGITVVGFSKWQMIRHNFYTDTTRDRGFATISHFRYINGILANTYYGLAETWVSGDPSAIYSYHKVKIEMNEILIGVGTYDSSIILAECNGSDVDMYSIIKTYWDGKQIETKQHTGDYSNYKIRFNIITRSDGSDYVLAQNFPYVDNSQYEYERPMSMLFRVQIEWEGFDIVDRFSFHKKILKIDDWLKAALFANNIRLSQDGKYVDLKKRNILINDETEIKKLDIRNVIAPNISQNELSFTAPDLTIFGESDVGTSQDPNQTGSIKLYEQFLTDKYNSMFKDSPVVVELKYSHILTGLQRMKVVAPSPSSLRIKAGDFINVYNKIFYVRSSTIEGKIDSLKGIIVPNINPEITITSSSNMISESGIVTATWECNNVAASFDVEIVIRKVESWTQNPTTGIYEWIYSDISKIGPIKNNGIYRCLATGFAQEDCVYEMQIKLAGLDYYKSFRFGQDFVNTRVIDTVGSYIEYTIMGDFVMDLVLENVDKVQILCSYKRNGVQQVSEIASSSVACQTKFNIKMTQSLYNSFGIELIEDAMIVIKEIKPDGAPTEYLVAQKIISPISINLIDSKIEIAAYDIAGPMPVEIGNEISAGMTVRVKWTYNKLGNFSSDATPSAAKVYLSESIYGSEDILLYDAAVGQPMQFEHVVAVDMVGMMCYKVVTDGITKTTKLYNFIGGSSITMIYPKLIDLQSVIDLYFGDRFVLQYSTTGNVPEVDAVVYKKYHQNTNDTKVLFSKNDVTNNGKIEFVVGSDLTDDSFKDNMLCHNLLFHITKKGSPAVNYKQNFISLPNQKFIRVQAATISITTIDFTAGMEVGSIISISWSGTATYLKKIDVYFSETIDGVKTKIAENVGEVTGGYQGVDYGLCSITVTTEINSILKISGFIHIVRNGNELVSATKDVLFTDPSFIEIKSSIITDGGTIPNEQRAESAILMLKSQNLWDLCVFFSSPEFGVKKDGNQYVSKVYDLKANADLVQATGTAQPKYQTDGSILYDGGDNITVPSLGINSPINCTKNISIGMWVRTVQNSNVKVMINRWGGTTDNQPFQIYISGSNLVVADFKDALGNRLVAATSFVVQSNTFNHIVATLDLTESDVNQRLKIYINGVKDNSTIIPTGVLTSLVETTVGFSIGCRKSDNGLRLPNTSKTALHQIYNSTLTAEQVLWNYNNIRPEGV